MKKVSDNKFQYEGSIEYAYKKKTILKVNAFFVPLYVFFVILIILAIPFPEKEILFLTLLLVLFYVVIPHFAIIVPLHFYLKKYVRNYTFKIKEDHILITHGVFTKKRVTIPYSRIQNINIENGVFDRLYKIYTIKIETAGASGAPSGGGRGGYIRPEGLILGIKEPDIIENKIKEMFTKYSHVPSGLEDKIFKPEEVAFDNFISYILSKMREGEKLKTSIKELREKNHLSAYQLAEKVGVPIQTINYLEEGRYNPSLTLAYKIAEVLKCKIEDLFKMV
jgi:putative transcriptional regulator